MKIPPQAKRVFKGEIFEVHQWDQNMFDGSKSTFEMIKRPDTVEIIAATGTEIFIAEEEQPNQPAPYVTLLGGRVDPGEEPLLAAKRELLEEAGLTADDWEPFMAYNPVAKMEWTVWVFVARNCKKTQDQHLDAGEKIIVKTVDFEEFFRIATATKFRSGEVARTLLYWQAFAPEKIAEFKQKLFG